MDDSTVADRVGQAMRAAKHSVAEAENLFPFGFTIDGFDIVQVIGSGGQGWVFKATQKSTGRAVAIKIMIDGRFADSRARRRFEREAKILASLNHPHVVSLLDQGCTSGGAHYLAMPFIEGITLDRIFADPRIDRKSLLSIMSKVIRAIAACHRSGVVHRDLKPDNILIDEFDHPHILDFGMARPLAGSFMEITRNGCDVGSLLWASPEQLRGDKSRVGPEADIYSLGVILYQALAKGRLPHRVENSLSETMRKILDTRPSPPSDDPRLNAVVERAMHKRIEDRYPSANALADAIEGLGGKETPRALRRFRKVVWITLLTMLIFVSTAFAIHSLVARSSVSRPSPIVPLPSRTNIVGMRLVRVPAGWYDMGTRPSSPSHFTNESLHRVIIPRSFWVATTETTNREWAIVMHRDVETTTQFNPIANVSLEEATDFCKRLSVLDGVRYRLPTDEEWEFAARAGTRDAVGLSGESLSHIGWYQDNSDEKTHTVAQLTPNGWGLYDTLGNVAEMCAQVDQVDQGPATTSSTQHVPVSTLILRGGSFREAIKDCTVSRRNVSHSDLKRPWIGFRVVAETD